MRSPLNARASLGAALHATRPEDALPYIVVERHAGDLLHDELAKHDVVVCIGVLRAGLELQRGESADVRVCIRITLDGPPAHVWYAGGVVEKIAHSDLGGPLRQVRKEPRYGIVKSKQFSLAQLHDGDRGEFLGDGSDVEAMADAQQFFRCGADGAIGRRVNDLAACRDQCNAVELALVMG